jgi:Lrp/AsnC family transcriptional regulator
MVRTRHHSEEWLKKFHRLVSNLPPVVDFYRIGGDYDYMLKIVARDMASYDACYRQLISEIDLETVTSLFVMEAIEEQRPIPLAAQRQN